MKFVVRAPDTLIEALDKLIDGKNFRSRNQLINIILADWVAREKYPVVYQNSHYANSGMGAGPPPAFTNVFRDDGTQITRNEARNEYRRQLLGDDWDKYQHSNALVFEEDETGEVNRQVRELERNQDEMKARIDALEAIIAKMTGAQATQPEEPQDESEGSQRGQTSEPEGSE